MDRRLGIFNPGAADTPKPDQFMYLWHQSGYSLHTWSPRVTKAMDAGTCTWNSMHDCFYMELSSSRQMTGLQQDLASVCDVMALMDATPILLVS